MSPVVALIRPLLRTRPAVLAGERGADFIAGRGGLEVAVGAVALADIEVVAGRQRGLAAGRGDDAGVVDLAAQQQHVAAALGGGGGRGGVDARAGLHLYLPQRVLEGGLRAVGIGIDALVAELLVGDGGGGGAGARALTWLVPVKITPFWLTTSTVPSALIAPWISLGFADAPTTRFSAASDAFCLNCSVVLRPTLKLSQFRMARDCVCSMVTTWRPSAVLFCGGALAFPFGLRALGRPQAARRQSVRHAGAIGAAAARGGLRRLLRGHGRRRAVQVVERALQLLARLRLLLAGVADAGQAAVRQAARALHGRLRRALVGEPAGTEGPRLRLRRARRAAGDQQRGHRLGNRRAPPGAREEEGRTEGA